MSDAATSVSAGSAPIIPWRGLVVGAAAGLLSGLFGIGGGIVIVPGLLTIMSMERRLAHGTSLGATIPTAAASLATFAWGDNVDWVMALFLAVGAIAGAVVGTQLLQIIPKRPLTIIFIVVILLTAVRLVLASDPTGRDPMTLGMAVALILIGFGTGTLSGLLGIGGGVIMVPAMIVLFSEPSVLAKGTSVAVIVPTSIVGTLRNRANDNVDLRIAATVGVAGVVFAVVGGLIATSISENLSNTLFALLLVIVAVIQARTLRPSASEPDGSD